MSATKNFIFDTTTFCNFYLVSIDDPFYNYQNLSDANRKSSYVTPIHGSSLCDYLLPEGWYRCVRAAGTKMPTTHVSAGSCDTDFPGWLNGTHPTVEDVEVYSLKFLSSTGCKYSAGIPVKNCGSYLIYKLHHPPACH